MIENVHEHMSGTDVSNEISLLEYGLLIAPGQTVNPAQCEHDDEYFCVYRYGDDQFDTGYIRISDIDKLVKGEDWASKEDTESMLRSMDIILSDWLELAPAHKIQDAIGYWGVENVFGSTYDTVDEDFVRGRYLNDPVGDVLLLIDEARGSYIPQVFGQVYGDKLRTTDDNGAQLDWTWELAALKEGPENEDYYEAMDCIERNGIIEINGILYDIEQDGDLWAYEHGKRRANSEN